MKLKITLFSLLAVFVLLILPLLSENAGAATYQGDGAVPNGSGIISAPVGMCWGPYDSQGQFVMGQSCSSDADCGGSLCNKALVSPSGWAEPPASPYDYEWSCAAMCHGISSRQFRKDTVCLECHGSGINTDYLCYRSRGAAFCDKSGYLSTGHKNMLRRVVPGSPWAGADGQHYGTADPYGSGGIFDWNGATVMVAGTQPAKTLFYIFGGWMSRDALNTVYDGGFTGELSSGGSYQCARCHTTGYRFDASGPLPSEADAQFSRIPAGGASSTSSWYLDGVQCERCHRDSANEAGGHVCYDVNGNHAFWYDGYWYSCMNYLGTLGPGTMTVAKPTYEGATALCIECHRQESVDAGKNIVLTTGLRVSNAGPSYTPFLFAGMGQSFLNSPHARFTGNLSQKVQNSPDLTVLMTGAYNSQFRNSSDGPDFGKNLGCTGCHDVHQSTVKAVNAAAPFKNQCPDCHSEGQSLGLMKHPSGQGTPLGDMTDVVDACKTCHMPDKYHLFRISVDAGYRTFPTEAQFNAGQTTANTANDGTFADAVWIDLDLACGQCHGGSGTAKAGVPYLTKAQLSAAAKSIHFPEAVASFFWTPDAATSYKVNFNASGSVCPSGYSCTYSWDFGDGSPAGSGVTTSHIFSGTTARTVTLTIASGSALAKSASQAVAPTAVNTAPTVGRTGWNVAGMTVTFSDSSTDDAVLPANAVTVYWGDGANEAKNAGSSFSHTFAAAGTYVVKQYVTDTGGLTSRWQDASGNDAKVTVPTSTTKYTISGNIIDTGGAPVSGATVSLKKNGITQKTTVTGADGTYSFSGINSGTYTVTASRSGYDWQTATGTQSLSLPVTVTVTTSNVTQDFHPAKSPAIL